MSAERQDVLELTKLADLAAALGEHVADLDRRVGALESGSPKPDQTAASDLKRIVKGLLSLSLLRRRRLRDSGIDLGG